MKIIFFAVSIIFLVLGAVPVSALNYPVNTIGRIIIETEKSGEAWYVYPKNYLRYYLGRPSDAFMVMRKLGLGAKHDLIVGTNVFPKNLSGLILLDVEKNGEAYYINPVDSKKYYLGRPSDAFALMRKFGLGITTNNISNIPAGNTNDNTIAPMPDELKFLITETITDQKVPFISQAPFGDWEDERQQDGCEEASALMAVAWARGEDLSKEEGLKNILSISDFEQKKYGEYRDIATADAINWIYKDYLNFQNVELKNNISADDIISELKSGNVVVLPANGQLLGNPNFTYPGPERHMLLVRGYDFVREEFITNDPGTRKGEAYRYKKNILFDAIRDYSTGYHIPIKEVRKNMLVVKKEL